MSVCAILLSYKRPQNMERIVAEVCKVPEIDKIILSNNNPEIDLRNWFDPAKYPIDLIDQPIRGTGAKRFEIALQQSHEAFFCPDDDIFLSAEQISALVEALIEAPEVAHGMYGQLALPDDSPDGIRFIPGVHGQDGFVDILNCAYFFTRQHVQRVYELVNLLGLASIHEAGLFEDVLLSFAGEGKPICHDIGAFEDCPTSHSPEIATFKRAGFDSIRAGVYKRLTAITGIE